MISIKSIFIPSLIDIDSETWIHSWFSSLASILCLLMNYWHSPNRASPSYLTFSILLLNYHMPNNFPSKIPCFTYLIDFFPISVHTSNFLNIVIRTFRFYTFWLIIIPEGDSQIYLYLLPVSWINLRVLIRKIAFEDQTCRDFLRYAFLNTDWHCSLYRFLTSLILITKKSGER